MCVNAGSEGDGKVSLLWSLKYVSSHFTPFIFYLFSKLLCRLMGTCGQFAVSALNTGAHLHRKSQGLGFNSILLKLNPVSNPLIKHKSSSTVFFLSNIIRFSFRNLKLTKVENSSKICNNGLLAEWQKLFWLESKVLQKKTCRYSLRKRWTGEDAVWNLLVPNTELLIQISSDDYPKFSWVKVTEKWCNKLKYLSNCKVRYLYLWLSSL